MDVDSRCVLVVMVAIATTWATEAARTQSTAFVTVHTPTGRSIPTTAYAWIPTNISSGIRLPANGGHTLRVHPLHTTLTTSIPAPTLLVANMIGGVIQSQTSLGATWNLPTPALAVAGAGTIQGGVKVGDSFLFTVVVNSGMAIVLSPPAGVTAYWKDGQVSATESKTFLVRFTSVSSGSEAYSIYRLT